MDALKYGKATESLLDEIAKVEASQEDIERQLVLEKARHMDLTAEHISFFLMKLRSGDIDDISTRRALITALVNAIYLYDDKYTVVFNASNQPFEVTESLLADIEADAGEFVFSVQSSTIQVYAPGDDNPIAVGVNFCDVSFY